LSLYFQVWVDAIGLLRVDVKDSGVGIDQEGVRGGGEFNQFNRNELQRGGNRLLCLGSVSTCTIYHHYRYHYLGGSGLGLWISRRIVHMHNVSRFS
jgi:signal transduction histidine kinase